MSEFNMACPNCRNDLTMNDDWIGMNVKCPLCSHSFPVMKDIPVMPAGSGEFNMACPNCRNDLTVHDDWIGMDAECPFCKNCFTVAKEIPVQKFIEPENRPRLRRLSKNPVKNGVPKDIGSGRNNSVAEEVNGEFFHLIAGENLLVACKTVRNALLQKYSYMRLTDQRIVFSNYCSVEGAAFWFKNKPSYISRQFFRNDIQDIKLKGFFRCRMSVIDRAGRKFSCTGRAGKLKKVMLWWQHPEIYPTIPVKVSGTAGRGKMSFKLKFLIWGIWLLIFGGSIAGVTIYNEMEKQERAAQRAYEMRQKRIQQEYDRKRSEYYDSGEYLYDLINNNPLKYKF